MTAVNVRVSIFLFLALLATQGAYADAVPPLFSYQGQLNDQGGTPVNGSVSMVFSIYDNANGGSAIWSEGQTVSVVGGSFAVVLGETIPLPNRSFLDSDLFLGIAVGADPEMLPRQKITSAAFSFRADAITEPEFSPSQVITHFFPDNGNNLVTVQLATVPTGRKWLVTEAQVIHQTQSGPLSHSTALLVGGVELLAVETSNSTKWTGRSFVQTWSHDLGPVLTAGTVIAGRASNPAVAKGVQIRYLDVPDSTASAETRIAAAVRAGSGSSTLGTVPAGKTWRVISYSVGISGTVSGPVSYSLHINGRAITVLTPENSEFGGDLHMGEFGYHEAPVASAGESVMLTVQNNLTYRASVVVIEE